MLRDGLVALSVACPRGLRYGVGWIEQLLCRMPTLG